MLRSLVKTGIACALHWTGAARVMGMLDASKNTPLVLGYHRVVDDFLAGARNSIPAMPTSSKMLERQLDCIGRRYRFVSLDELASSLAGEASFSRPIAAVTFDDGYADVYYNAFPLLKRKGIPAAIFVVTDLVGTSNLLLHDELFLLLSRAFAPSPAGRYHLTRFLQGLGIELPAALETGAWDHSRAVNSLLAALPHSEIRRLIEALATKVQIEKEWLEPHRMLTWNMVIEMHREGITVGSHTKTHTVLINEKFERISDETEDSRNELQRRLGTVIRHIAYPDGQFNAAAIMAAAASGYRYGYTTCRHRDPIHPLLTIPRVLLWENSCLDARGRFSPRILDCLVGGFFDFAIDCERDHALRATNLIN